MRVGESRTGLMCLAVSLLLSLGLFAASVHGTGAYFSATVSGTFTGTVGGDSCRVVATVTGVGGTVSPASQSVTRGGSATVLVTPDRGYHIATITDNGSSIATVSPVVLSAVAADHTITATFAKNAFVITVTQGANGTISPGTTTVNYGATVTFRITPKCGCRVVSVTVDGTSVGARTSYTFTSVAADHTITATFAKNAFVITVTQGANGTISPGTTTVNYGATVTFRITPKCGYRVVSVTVDGTSVGARTSYTFTSVTAGHTITAAFAKDLKHRARPVEAIELGAVHSTSWSSETTITPSPAVRLAAQDRASPATHRASPEPAATLVPIPARQLEVSPQPVASPGLIASPAPTHAPSPTPAPTMTSTPTATPATTRTPTSTATTAPTSPPAVSLDTTGATGE